MRSHGRSQLGAQHEQEREQRPDESDALLPAAIGHDQILDEPAQPVAAVECEIDPSRGRPVPVPPHERRDERNRTGLLNVDDPRQFQHARATEGIAAEVLDDPVDPHPEAQQRVHVLGHPLLVPRRMTDVPRTSRITRWQLPAGGHRCRQVHEPVRSVNRLSEYIDHNNQR